MNYMRRPQDAAVTRLLCVADAAAGTERLRLALHQAAPECAWELRCVDDAQAFAQALDASTDVVLFDVQTAGLPAEAALAVLAGLHGRGWPAPAFIVLAQDFDEALAARLLRCGARSYVTLDRLALLPAIIHRLVAERDDAREKARLAAELQTAYHRLQTLSARLLSAQERERDQLSHELHDDLAQTLAGVMLHLHAARAAGDPGTSQAHGDTAIRMTQGAIDQLKAMSFALRPAQLDLLGLMPTLETLVDKETHRAALHASVRSRGVQPCGLGNKAAFAVRLVQEAVRNVARHAQATRVWVRVRFMAGGRLAVLVIDNGIGFDPRRLLVEPHASGDIPLGLRGLAEQTELAGGRFRVRSRPGRGVAVRAML